MRKPQARLIDIDGTLAQVHHLSHHIKKIPGQTWKDFTEFHARSPHVEPKQQALDYIADTIAAGMVPIILTARREMWVEATREFLDRVLPGVAYELLMRPDDHSGDDVEFKQHTLGYLSRHYEVVGAIEDSPRVAAMLAAAGIPVEMVHDTRWDELQEDAKA